MSNSAFTPTTTEVTTEVPVNVPVVTSQEQFYTPTITAVSGTNPTLGTVTTNTASYRRVGDHLQVTYNLVQTSVGSTGSDTYKISLPPGLTIDTTKLPANSPVVGNATIFNGVDRALFAVLVRDSTGVFLTGLYDAGEGEWGHIFYPLNNASLFVRVTFSVPIAEWAGSGTTTLATRAVEEYAAWNSTGAGTSTIVSGLAGGSIPTDTPAGTFEAVIITSGYSNVILPTDIFELEYQLNSSASWQKIGTSDIERLRFDGTNYIGAAVETAGTNGVRIIRGKYSRGTSASWAGFASSKWRVRKVSSGAQVGYPVSARNIVGDTSGSVVPTGMLGETLSVTASGSTAIPTTTGDISGISLSLSPGVWRLSLKASVYMKHSAGSNQNNSISLFISDASNTLISNSGVQQQVENQPTMGSGMSFVFHLESSCTFVNTTTQTIKMRGIRANLASGSELLNDGTTRITGIIATRIA